MNVVMDALRREAAPPIADLLSRYEVALSAIAAGAADPKKIARHALGPDGPAARAQLPDEPSSSDDPAEV